MANFADIVGHLPSFCFLVNVRWRALPSFAFFEMSTFVEALPSFAFFEMSTFVGSFT